MSRHRARAVVVGIAVGCLLAGSPLFAQEEETPVRIDYLTFAQGAISLAIGGPGAEVERPPHHHHQLHWIDGNPLPRGFIATSDLDISTEFTYQLPALTTFDRLAVPNVLEVPSPGTTFTRYVEVHGSSVGHDEGYELLASGELSTHQRRGEVTELTIAATPAVRWVKLVLRGGIENLNPDQMGFEFSEIIGNGTQEPKPFAENFTGAWSGRREANIELVQDGPVVTGCYDRQGLLEGTIDGNLLRAHGVDQGRAKTPSVFILTVLDNGRLTGVRSTNGGPFGIYTGPPVDDVENLDCLTPPQPLGCGSTVYGISFDFDSATINTESEEVLSKLYEGLSGDESAEILIKGHTSSEGSDSYNQALSERRAQAVVDDMVRRGIEAGRMRAVGIGEGEPIATNDDEAGRSLNRRVEIECR